MEKAEKDLAAVTDQYMSKLVKELHGTDFWKLRRAYSPAVRSSTKFELLKLIGNPTFLIVNIRFVFCPRRCKSMLKLQHFVDFARPEHS